MPEVPLAQVEKALPFGAWHLLGTDRWGAEEYETGTNIEGFERFTPEAVHEAVNEPCGTCEGDGGCICVLCDPDDRRYNGTTVKCGDHRFVYVDHEEYGPGCNGTGSAAPELWELVNG